MNTHALTIALPLLAYLSGAVPCGLLIVRMVAHCDIRRVGSGNIGATNVRRTAGTSWGVVTLLCDALKGALPTIIALRLAPMAPHWLAPLVALAAVSGHIFPVYLKFKPSGKGVATALGCFGVLAPGACGLALIAFIVIVTAKRVVSVASMAAMALLPLLIWLTTRDSYLTGSSFLTTLLIISRHKANIERLCRGKEPTLNG
jgi:acyl phosphate:glycerol-3-phosphate acyltransferase